MLENNGRGERIRTSDLTVPNDRRGKNVSICLFESCSHQGILRFLHSFPFFTIRYRVCAENSVHKLATKNWGEPRFGVAHQQGVGRTGGGFPTTPRKTPLVTAPSLRSSINRRSMGHCLSFAESFFINDFAFVRSQHDAGKLIGPRQGTDVSV
jgi:hypothetical protein